MIMRIAIACDHAGYPLKDEIAEVVKTLGHDVIDLGTNDTTPVDYPDFSEKAGRMVVSGAADRAIVICGSGVGACVAANKVKGVYAAMCHDTYSAHQGVEHDNVNLLCLGARIIGPELAKEVVKAFLGAAFYDEGRYLRRFNKILAIEAKG